MWENEAINLARSMHRTNWKSTWSDKMNGKDNKTRLFLAAVFFFWFSQYTYVPHLSAYLKEMGASLTLIGIVTGSYGFTQMAARIPLGLLSDRIGKRKIFVSIGLFLAFAANMLFLLFHSDLMMVAARGTAGLAAASWVIITVLYSSYFQAGKSTHAMGSLSAINNLGRLVGMLLAGIALLVFSGYRAMFVIGAAGAVIAFIFSLFIEENVPENRKPMTLAGFLKVIRNKQLLCMSCAMLIGQFYISGMVSGFTPLLAAEYGAVSWHRSALSIVDIAMSMLGALTVSSASADKAGEQRYMLIRVIALSILTLCIPFSPNLPVLFILQGLGGFCTGSLSAMFMGLSIRHFPDDQRSTAMGCYQAIYGIGMFLGPVLIGGVADALGMRAGYIMVAALLLLIIPLILIWAGEEQKERI